MDRKQTHPQVHHLGPPPEVLPGCFNSAKAAWSKVKAHIVTSSLGNAEVIGLPAKLSKESVTLPLIWGWAGVPVGAVRIGIPTDLLMKMFLFPSNPTKVTGRCARIFRPFSNSRADKWEFWQSLWSRPPPRSLPPGKCAPARRVYGRRVRKGLTSCSCGPRGA